ncbi:MAG: hypothetical protein M3N48_05070, partial [Verrucomicrobiota bacterium]|nr:hypothetical protein [Verrucomicrobiota bacterium]
RITAIDSISTSGTLSNLRPARVLSTQPIQNSVPQSTITPFSGGSSGQVDVAPVDQTSNPSYAAPVAQQRLVEQPRRELTIPQGPAAPTRNLANPQKAVAKDTHVPLGEWGTVSDVGGETVWVKIIDNDTTSFNVSINYGVRREVRKEKGISGSGTDETLIYSNGRASLYYVWEISGRINHCLLRVRDA